MRSFNLNKMRFVVGSMEQKGDRLLNVNKFFKWLETFTKISVTAILIVSLIDWQLTYVLAFMGREQIAETLSSTISDTVVGVMIGYFVKSLLETFLQEREKRLNKRKEE